MNKNRIHNLHIPKTAGHYIYSTAIFPLAATLHSHNIRFSTHHDGWRWVDDQTYIISSFRDPAKRTASHFAYSARFDIYNDSPLEVSRDGLLRWVDDNIDYISDFQSKNFLYSPKQAVVPYFYIKDTDFLNIKNITKDQVMQKLSMVDIFLKDTTLNEQTMGEVIDKICNDFNIPRVIHQCNVVYNDYEPSKNLYTELSDSDKEYLYSINPIDSDIYFNSSLFFK